MLSFGAVWSATNQNPTLKFLVSMGIERRMKAKDGYLSCRAEVRDLTISNVVTRIAGGPSQSRDR